LASASALAYDGAVLQVLALQLALAAPFTTFSPFALVCSETIRCQNAIPLSPIAYSELVRLVNGLAA
jgi:hypothetical protein